MDSPAQTNLLITNNKFQRWLIISTSMLLIGLLAAFLIYWRIYLPHTCTVHAVQEASSFLNSQLATFDHEYQFATTVAPEAIKIPMETLQQIWLDTGYVDVPRCVRPAKAELLEYMRIVLQAFEAYRTRAADATVSSLVNQSNTHYDEFVAKLADINRCAPYCLFK
jgi:hypothetical protein